jgi:hypothetical protein
MNKKEDYKQIYEHVTEKVMEALGPLSGEQRFMIEMVVGITMKTYQLMNEMDDPKPKKRGRGYEL